MLTLMNENPLVNQNKLLKRNKLLFQLGIWIGGKIFWLEKINEKLFPAEQLSVKIKSRDVHSKIDLYDLYFTNHSNVRKELKILFLYKFEDSTVDQLCFISPVDQCLFHFAEEQNYLVNTFNQDRSRRQSTVVPIWHLNSERFWMDPDSGELKYQPMSKDASASIMAIKLYIPPHRTQVETTWSIYGKDTNENTNLNQLLLKNRLAFPEE